VWGDNAKVRIGDVSAQRALSLCGETMPR